ncbi:MAG: bifunctional precorrin-2 dehydrogenase/sirohydrochlorin ferrochelatase [Pseudomonadota bacterium]
MPNTYLPISISLKDRPVLVVGGGEVALRKIDTLLDYNCAITVVAPEATRKIEYYAKKGDLKLEKRQYRSPEAADYGIVISAGSDADVNATVAADAGKAGVPVNVADSPKLCDFIFPAVVRRDCLTIAVSTDGLAPFLSGQLRSILDGVFPDRWKKIARLAASFRRKVRDRWKDDKARKTECFNRFFSADWETMIKTMSEKEIDEALAGMVEGKM